jgi:undecaprenyl-diphosphatase
MTVPYRTDTAFYADSRQWFFLAVYLVVATIPAALVGFLFRDVIDEVLRTPYVMALALIFGGGLLWLADVYGRQNASLQTMNWWRSLIIGLSQVAALIPGFSRSGSTITGGLATGLTRTDAATFSFLLGAPIILGAAIVEAPNFIATYQFSFASMSAFVLSIVSTYGALWGLYHFIEKHSYHVFVIYRIILGLLVLGYLATL